MQLATTAVLTECIMHEDFQGLQCSQEGMRYETHVYEGSCNISIKRTTSCSQVDSAE